MARGGRREGAGRPRGSTKLPSVVDDIDVRLWVGMQCERLWDEAWAAKAEEARAADRPNYDAAVAKLFEEENRQAAALGRPLTMAERAEARRVYRQQQQDPDADDFAELHAMDVEKALKLDQGLLPANVDALPDDRYIATMEDADEPAIRLHRVVVPKPQGVRPQIVDDVRQMIDDRYGVSMSGDWVVKCWDEFRALERAVRDSSV